MKLHALLAFYDEPTAALISGIASLKTAGVDHVIAMDGAYALYPDAQPASDANQHGAIVVACREVGMACTLHVPTELWAGNEAEKRTALFALGWAHATDGDWFMIHDADMAVTKAPDDLKARLAATDRHSAEVEVLDVVAQAANHPQWPARFNFRQFYRAQPITVGPAHCIYRSEAGPLWNGNGVGDDLPSLDLQAVMEVEHRPDARPLERQLAKRTYYARRDESGMERSKCDTEGCETRAVRLVASRWKLSKIGPVSSWVEACEPCAQRLEKVSRIRLRQLGVDPDAVGVENRNGHIPAGMTAGRC